MVLVKDISSGIRLASLFGCVSEALSVVGRYFGSAEDRKFVEMASVDNVKRTWVGPGSGVISHRDRWEGKGCGSGSILFHCTVKSFRGWF